MIAIGAVETLCQDRRNVEECGRVLREQGGRVGDVKLRGFQRTHVRGVWLIQQHGEFAEHGAGLRYLGDLDALLDDFDRAP